MFLTIYVCLVYFAFGWQGTIFVYCSIVTFGRATTVVEL